MCTHSLSPPPPCVLPARCSGLLSPNTSVTISVDHSWSWLHNVLAWERSHSRVGCVRVHQQLTHSYYAATRAGAGVLAWPGDTQHPNTGWRSSNTKTFSLILLTSRKQLHPEHQQQQQQPCEKFQIFLLLMIIFRKALYKTLIKYFSLDVTLSFSCCSGVTTQYAKVSSSQSQEVRKVCIETRLGLGLMMNTKGRILLCNLRTI